MQKYLRTREIQSPSRTLKAICEQETRPLIFQHLQEKEFSGLKCYDKVFASTWIDHETVALGTKDNRFLVWNINSDRRFEIHLPSRLSSLQHSVLRESCGIHSIEVNPSGTLLATGGSNPNDTAVFSIPSFEYTSTLVGHEDWMFAATWLTDTTIATGSRDSTIKVWMVDDKPVNVNPLLTKTDHADKVRDLKYNHQTEILASLSHDGTCKQWDPYFMEVIQTTVLPCQHDLACMALDKSLIAIGSQSLIMFLDTRCGKHVKTIKSVDGVSGVRSLSIRDNIVTCGGGMGKISFLDLRVDRYLRVRPCDTERKNDLNSICLTTGQGYIEENVLYSELFPGQVVRHAVYTHSYDISGTKLFTAGGPLAYGIRGCYVGLWQ